MKQLSIILFLSYTIGAQNTIVLKPDAKCGKDAVITNSTIWGDGSTPHSIPNPDKPWLRVESWTANSQGASDHDLRSLIEFHDLKNIKSAIVNSATLVLYAYPNFPHSNGGQAETNASEIYRVIEYWEEDQVTWLTQPSIDMNMVVEIPENNNYDKIEVDVTNMVQMMIDNPDSSYGFLIRQKDEEPYGSMDFASSDYPDLARAPELIINVDDVQYWTNNDIDLFSTVDTSFCIFHPNELVPDIDPDLVISTLWNTGSTENAINVKSSGVYWVELNLINCVIKSDTIRVSIDACEEMYSECLPHLPNAFSPNGDGINDRFTLVSGESNCYKNFDFKVYNRWGNLVFTTNDINENWDGTVNGTPGITGVYIYTLNYTLINDVKYHTKGDLTLLR